MRCDVLVIGGGHAGAEASLACARLGAGTILLTSNLSQIGRMPCNPSIGGPAKAHLVREIDALGGEMGRAIDDTHIHIRNLNTGKGPAVQALRAQADRPRYSRRIAEAVFSQDNLSVVADSAASLITEGRAVRGVRCASGREINARAVVICTGTFLEAVLHIGDICIPGGRSGEPPSRGMSASLASLGLRLGRLKTGTCPRLHRDTVNTDGLDVLKPSLDGLVFSDMSDPRTPLRQTDCWITRTNEKTRQAVMENLHRSPLYGGAGGGITGVGPRYCPSLEDKFVRFPEREFHLVFLEPEGFDAPEIYLQGVSTSMPLDVQVMMARSLPGLEKAEIIRPGYAVEYDYIDPTQLDYSLAVRGVEGLYLAGQINGSSGYEEAAGQGLLAGINAFRYISGLEPVRLQRDEAYIGVLVDDLICRGTSEPYRMHTSRAEYRLLLREDNADDRLTPLGRRIGLVDDRRWDRFVKRRQAAEDLRKKLDAVHISGKCAQIFENLCGTSIVPGALAADAVRRPDVKLGLLAEALSLSGLAEFTPYASIDQRVIEKTEVALKYEGYIAQQKREVVRMRKLEEVRIPESFSYYQIAGVSAEASEKLSKLRPVSVGQASRIPGVSPSDIAALLVCLRRSSSGEADLKGDRHG